MNYCFVHKLSRSPILNVVDITTGSSMKAYEAMKVLESIWINSQCTPEPISVDAELVTKLG